MVPDPFAFIAIPAAVFICLYAELLGRFLGVMDLPDKERKKHAHATPLIGGIAILIPLSIWLAGSLWRDSAQDAHLLYALLLCALGVGVVGFADDQTPSSPLSRTMSLAVFLGVAFVIAPELIAPGLNWSSFQDSTTPAWLYCTLMTVAAVGVVNAVNMADGQNGLVPSMYVVWSACLMLAGDESVAAIAAVLLGLSLIVLAFNIRGKLFLGDCGSYGVTFVIGLLTMLVHAQGKITVEAIAVWFFIPVMDCLRLCITRLSQGRSPAAPDTDHFHHRLQDKLGKNYGLAAYVATVGVPSFVTVLAPQLSLVCIVVLTAVYFSFAWLTDSAAARISRTLSLDHASLRPLSTVQNNYNVVPITLHDQPTKRELA